MLLNDHTPSLQYFVRLSNGQEIGPFLSYDAAATSAATMPIQEGGTPPQIIPKTAAGSQLLFG